MKLKRWLPLLTTFLIILSSVSIWPGRVLAENTINLIENRIPVAFGSADVDKYVLNDGKVRFASSGSANITKGYDLSDGGTKEFWADKLIALTDGDDQNGQYLRPQNSEEKDRVILLYRFAKSNVSELTLKIAGTKRKSFSIFLSEEQENLFTTSPAYTVSKDKSNGFSQTFESEKSCSYMAVVLESPDYVVNEITLLGTVAEKGENILTGSLPSMYASATADKFEYNWFQISYGTGANKMKHGYSESAVTGTKEFWNAYTNNLTDNDSATSLFIKPEVKNGNDRVIVVYTLSDFYDLNGFDFAFGAGNKNFSVYLSKNRDELFAGHPASQVVKFSGEEYEDVFPTARVKYIGIVLETPNYEVLDFAFFGEKYVQAEKGPNVLLNTTPITYASTNSGEFAFNWTQTYYSETEMKHGYDSQGNGFRDFWQEHVAKLTDGDIETALYIKAERTWNKDNVLIIYNIDDSVINGFTLKTDSQSKKSIEVYASTSISNLFENLLLKADTYDTDITDDGTLERRARYVGMILTAPSYSVCEIEVNANPYVRPDYGTNLLEGKLPQKLFLADRTYPIIPNADEIIDIWKTNSNLKNATDGDFKTSVSWAPAKAKTRVNKDTRYMVLSYDLGDICTIDKVFLDSGLAGFDLYVSDQYDDLFESFDHRVYTSKGDQLRLNGETEELDPATNLQPGEILQDLGGVTGRYIGLVITRAQAAGATSYEIVNITEFQVFGTPAGTNYGDNLLSEKAPIMCYRAKYGTYGTSVGQMSSASDLKLYTDGDVVSGAEINFPNAGGLIQYDYGALVLIYYLEGPCEINRVALDSVFYYGVGGVDLYTAGTFADLFKKENCVYSTNGATAEDGVYDPAYNCGARGISHYFDNAVTGRYAAFVITRISDSNVKGWGIFRLTELTLQGKKLENEVLPNTTLIDSSTGASATFEYANPDEKFVFGKKGIKSFKLRYLDGKQYQTDTFTYSLASGGYEPLGKAFVLEFYDKNGKRIAPETLDGEQVSLVLKLNAKEKKECFLANIRDGFPYLIKSAVKINGAVHLTVEKFDDVYILLKYSKTPAFSENLSDGSLLTISGVVDDSLWGESVDPIWDTDISENDDEVTSTEEDIVSDGSKKSKKGWMVIQTEDPLQWFWDIYDTFADHIWMLVVCIAAAVGFLASVIIGIIFCKKRRV